MSSSRLLLGAAVVGVATLVWWFAAGETLVALIDRITTTPLGERTPQTRFSFDEGNAATVEGPRFAFGDRSRAVTGDWRAIEQPPSHLSIETSQGAMELGALTQTWIIRDGQHGYEFSAAAGDVVTFTRRRSRLSWPRPFAFNWLGGTTSRWSRFVYNRLEWRKASGAAMIVVWRDEQRLTTAPAWVDQYLPAPPVSVVSLTPGDRPCAHRRRRRLGGSRPPYDRDTPPAFQTPWRIVGGNQQLAKDTVQETWRPMTCFSFSARLSELGVE